MNGEARQDHDEPLRGEDKIRRLDTENLSELSVAHAATPDWKLGRGWMREVEIPPVKLLIQFGYVSCDDIQVGTEAQSGEWLLVG